MDLYQRVHLSTIPSLDCVRALAAGMVILYHADVPWASGSLGVMAFFVLSGFLITWLLLKENEGTGTVSLRAFYIRRALRILSAFYVFWAIYILLAVIIRHNSDWGQYFSSFFYFSNYYRALVNPPHMAMAHTWSLAIEEQFYLLWPWVFLHFKGDLKKLTRLLLWTILAVWVYRLFLYSVVHAGYWWLYGAFDCRADHLAIGCLMAVLIRRNVAMRIFRAITAHPALPLLTLTLLSISVYLRILYDVPYQFYVGFMLDPVLLAILLAQWIAVSDAPMWRWMNSPFARYLGRLSYSAYLYHWLLDYVLLNSSLGRLPLWIKVVAALVGSNLMAAVSYALVEKPFLKLKKRLEYGTPPRTGSWATGPLRPYSATPPARPSFSPRPGPALGSVWPVR